MDNVRPRQKRIKADALNDAIQGGRLAAGTRVRGGRQSQSPGTGQVIDVTQHGKRRLVPIGTVRTVIVRKSPSPAAGWVRVQPVRYSDWPVQPCTDAGCRIGIAGPEIDVRPYYGKKDSSYTDFEVVGDALDISKTFLDIKWDGRQWVMEPPPGGAIPIQAVRITSIIGSPSTSERLNVIKVHENDQGAIVDDGGEVEGGYATWYHLFGRHYGQFVGRTPPVILPAVFVDGDWRVWQMHRFRSANPTGAVTTTLCGT